MIDQLEFRCLFPNARRLGGERNLVQDVKDFVTKKCEKKHCDRSEDRAEDFTAIKLQTAKSAKEADNQQRTANSKEQKISPWKIAGDWKPGEEVVRKQSADGDNKTNPDRPISFSFHVDFAVAIRRIQR